MKSRKKQVGRKIPIVMALGIMCMILVGLAICVVASLLLANGKIETQHILPITIISYLLISLLGSYIAVKSVGGRYAIVCLGTAIGYTLLLMLCTVVFFCGQFDAMGWRVCACLSGGVISCLLCTVRKRNPKRPKM